MGLYPCMVPVFQSQTIRIESHHLPPGSARGASARQGAVPPHSPRTSPPRSPTTTSLPLSRPPKNREEKRSAMPACFCGARHRAAGPRCCRGSPLRVARGQASPRPSTIRATSGGVLVRGRQGGGGAGSCPPGATPPAAGGSCVPQTRWGSRAWLPRCPTRRSSVRGSAPHHGLSRDEVTALSMVASFWRAAS
jgi:hypothetical protein